MKEMIKKIFLAVALIASLHANAQTNNFKWVLQSTYTAAGTDTYTATITGLLAYGTGLEVKILFTNANGGSATLNINSLGAITLKKNGSTNLAAADITAGQTLRLSYDGTNFQVLGLGGSGGGGGVTSVTGTTNRITSTGGLTPAIDISASYVGQSSITTLGTIGTGTWNGGVVQPLYGGTGITSLGTGVATWLGTPSWTNFNSAITGTAPFWKTAGTSTLTAATNIDNGNNAAIGVGFQAGDGTGAESFYDLSYNQVSFNSNDGVGTFSEIGVAPDLITLNSKDVSEPLNNYFNLNGVGATYRDGKTVKTGIQYFASGYETTDLSLISRGFANATYAPISGGSAYWKTGGTSTLTSANTITATGTNNLTFNFATLGANNGVTINSTATDAAANTQTAFRVNQSGANATSTQTTYGGYVSNTKTGTANTNIGLYGAASGGTTNWAGYFDGDVRVKDFIYSSVATNTRLQFRNDNLLLLMDATGAAWNNMALGSLTSYGGITTTAVYANGGAANGPSYSFQGDTDTGIWSPAADVLGFSLGGVEQMRLTGGNLFLGTGTIAASTKLDVRGISGGTNIYRFATDGNVPTLTGNDTQNNSLVHLAIGGGATASELRFLEPSGSGSNYFSIKAPALAVNNPYTWADAYPAVSGYVLSSTTAGVMSWIAAAGSGTVTSVTSANADATVATTTTTPVITIVSAPKLTTARTISLTGDVTYTSSSFDGSANATAAATVTRINGVALSGLATGILKNTTTSGVPSIAIAADFPTLNQSTTGNAATVTTNANLTGGVTSVGNAATVITNANLTGHVTSTGNATVLGSFTKAQLDGAVSDGNVLYVGDVTQYTDELAQDAVGAMVDASLTYVDGTPLLQRAALTGDVTASAGSNATTVGKINGTTMSGLATGILKNTTGTGVPSIAVNSDLPVMSATVGGAVPTPPNNTTTFLRGDGTFAVPAGGITNTAANTELMVSNGTNAIGGKIFSPANGNLTFGDAGLAGNRTLSAINSTANAQLTLTAEANRLNFLSSSIYMLTSGLYASSGFTISGGSTLNIGGRGITLGGVLVTSSAATLITVAGDDISSTATGQGHIYIRGGNTAVNAINAGDVHIAGGETTGTGKAGNIAIGTQTTPNWQSMERGLFVREATTNPTGNPTAGAFFYADAADSNKPKWRVPGGTTYDLSLGGGTYYAPNALSATATDANFTAAVNSIRHIPDGVATANRIITIPAGVDGDVIELHNNEDTFIWSFTGATVYLSDRTTVVTELLFNVPTLMQKINGLWIIKN